MMECARSTPPPKGFLEAVRALCDAHGALLCFDEVSSAWRENCGGR
jgi:glutamate-1-semialdehyde 2,1-aminomutase